MRYEKTYPIPVDTAAGRLMIVRRPRGGGDLGGDMESLRREGVDILISLLEDHESLELGLGDETMLAGRHGMRFISLPVPDYSVPVHRTAFHEVVHDLADAVAGGSCVAMHCHGSIGRSSLLAISILRRLGFGLDEAIALVREARGVRVPETEEQLQWLREG